MNENAGNKDASGRFQDDCPECGEYECVCRGDADEERYDEQDNRRLHGC